MREEQREEKKSNGMRGMGLNALFTSFHSLVILPCCPGILKCVNADGLQYSNAR